MAKLSPFESNPFLFRMMPPCGSRLLQILHWHLGFRCPACIGVCLVLTLAVLIAKLSGIQIAIKDEFLELSYGWPLIFLLLCPLMVLNSRVLLHRMSRNVKLREEYHSPPHGAAFLREALAVLSTIIGVRFVAALFSVILLQVVLLLSIGTSHLAYAGLAATLVTSAAACGLIQSVILLDQCERRIAWPGALWNDLGLTFAVFGGLALKTVYAAGLDGSTIWFDYSVFIYKWVAFDLLAMVVFFLARRRLLRRVHANGLVEAWSHQQV